MADPLVFIPYGRRRRRQARREKLIRMGVRALSAGATALAYGATAPKGTSLLVKGGIAGLGGATGALLGDYLYTSTKAALKQRKKRK